MGDEAQDYVYRVDGHGDGDDSLRGPPVSGIELPGLQALREEAGLTEIVVSGPLRALADQAEAEAPEIDSAPHRVRVQDAGPSGGYGARSRPGDVAA